VKASKSELTKSMDTDDMTMYEGVWGEMHIEYDIFKKKFDITPFLKGLPNDRDQCPHWGIVTKGQLTIKYDGKEEVVKAGDAYYAPPGHTGMFEAGTELWEFSPMDKMQKTMEVIMRNMQAMAPKQK
jgi:mannose-6-phosphate isomerase-like protein (cupin superfamily)